MMEMLLIESIAALWSVLEAITTLVVFFLVAQFLWLKLPRRQVIDVLAGTAVASLGLFLFLLGMELGFLPFGKAIGMAFGAMDQKAIFIVSGVLLGFFTTWGEPAVRVLADQVEETSNGSIPKNLMLTAICVGVALCVGLGVARLIFKIPLLYLLAPGYLLAIAFMWRSDPQFVAIAADAGGVATGPLANTFLLALAMGASVTIGDQDPIAHGLGLVALISLAPVISVMALGFLVRVRVKGSAPNAESLPDCQHRPEGVGRHGAASDD
jgi:multisubunit Na+/H+ antiporter MnhC subunit